MALLMRKIAIFIMSVALALSGAASLSHDKSSAARADWVSLHESHTVQHYADLAIEASEDAYTSVHVAVPIHHSHDDGQCKNCCAACMTASLLPPSVVLLVSQIISRQTFTLPYDVLVANLVATDPDIPKSV